MSDARPISESPHRKRASSRADVGFDEWIQRSLNLIHKVSNAYCRDREDRHDLVQEIVIQLWRSRRNYDASLALSTWVYRIALNVAISFYRKERKHKEKREDLEPDLITEVEDLSAQTNEEIATLYHCIGELDELNKALVLLYLDGQDQKTISDILGITTTNVATRISRVKARLRDCFQKQLHGDERTTDDAR